MATLPAYGASPDDWTHFDLLLGLGCDLLPVVSNPTAVISPKSKMRDLGKTPSRYNNEGHAVGIPGWTDYQASDSDITRWSKDGDIGICLQTRTVRGLDIDVPDFDLSKNIRAFILTHLGQALPCRSRANSGKLLLGFTIQGEMPKRKMVVDGGIVEFLATGQQFIAIGTHPSGSRYEWEGGLPDAFPELDLAQFEALWSALATRFAIEPVGSGELSMRKRGKTVDMADDVADFLAVNGLVLGTDRDKALLVKCPWDSDHSTGSAGDGSTVYFPAGTNGYERGHFKCLHGHCTGRGDSDFEHAIGYLEQEFSVVVAAASEPSPLPKFVRDSKGKIEATVRNVQMALMRPDFCGIEIKYDEFRDEIMFAPEGGNQWVAFTDADYTRLRITLERKGFKAVGRELIRDTVLLVAEDNPFDSAQAWLDQQVWDGTPRVDKFLVNYFGTVDTPYTKAVSRYLWTALAGRIVTPGVKADMVPILVGGQGVGKSTGVSAMCPATEFFTEVSFHEKEDDLARRMRGRLVGEIGELRGLHTRELETIKAFITRTHESWVPKYREFATSFPRRIVFIGTTNKEEFLADETGNRRWLPVAVTQADVEAIRSDHTQLWAEGRVMYDLVGIDYQDAEGLAGAVHEAHTIRDSWEDSINQWLDEPDSLTGETPRTSEFLRVGDVLKGALGYEAKHIARREEMRVGAALRNLGYERKKLRDGERLIWGYLPSVPTPFPPIAQGGNI
jgi:predicted P-loop ATPase